MALRRGPPKRPPVDVVDVGTRTVPFLRPLEWVATALRTFRERPLPGSYTTEAVPTFDLFGTAQLQNYQVEVVVGGVGALEVTGSQVATDKWRQYLSISVNHDDIIGSDDPGCSGSNPRLPPAHVCGLQDPPCSRSSFRSPERFGSSRRQSRSNRVRYHRRIAADSTYPLHRLRHR